MTEKETQDCCDRISKTIESMREEPRRLTESEMKDVTNLVFWCINRIIAGRADNSTPRPN